MGHDGPAVAWQASLFDSGSVRPDADFATLHRVSLDDRSWVDHAPGWLSGSDELFALLLERGAWHQRSMWMYDRRVLEPRLTAGWTSGSGVQRTWSRTDTAPALLGRDPHRPVDRVDPVGIVNRVGRVGTDDPDGDPAAPVSAMPEDLRHIADLLSRRYERDFDSVWVNLYRDGRDSVAWHSDRNGKTLTNPLVVTVSLGARRRFLLRRKGSAAASHRLALGSGDLVVMGGACQHEWEHTVPKTAKPVGARMSVTMRHSC